MPGSRSAGEADALGLPLRRVVGGSNSQGLGHEYLVDAVAVHVHDLEGEPLPLEAVTAAGTCPRWAITISPTVW